MVLLVAMEEAANRRNEGYKGKELKSICSEGGGGQIAELWEPCQELSNLEGCRPHIPGGQIHGMSGIAKEVCHRVLGAAAIGAGRLIGPAYRMTVGLESRAMA